MAAWLDALAAAEGDNQPAVLVTVLAAKGSTPREAGAKMVVSADGLAGTIGGGNLEYQCEAAARDLLASGGEGPSTRDFPLGPSLGQCCGGHVTVLFEVLRPPKLQIALFGAGHVGTALVRLLADLPCRVQWIDPRPEALPANLPSNVIPVRTAQPAQTIAGLPSGSVVLVMTHDHQLDFDIVVAALRRPDLRAVGLIGSDTKRARFLSRLARQGIPTDKLICPIGLPGIEGKEPAVVALSVAAQIMQLNVSLPTTERSIAPMPKTERSCGDCVCPPVTTQGRR
ncbi:MAG TPA: xanthine dehydrogenase accessory protein XdhC [Acetobacteraceae bacterium]|jgi:xanthine dehydrogenase accessory factor|nr:xanthine dehydrogenase accessory protein XdhC [Acetobacteraceae bacterium]